MTLAELIATETARPLPPAAVALAQTLSGRFAGARIVLFYGSCLRDGRLDGVADFYVLTERPRNLADRILAPTVYFLVEGGIRAKVAVMPLGAFARAMRPQGSPHLWARFCQPTAIAWAADPQARRDAEAALAAALRAAAWWAEHLAPSGASAEQAWRTLFEHTYGAELRAERADRPMLLVATDRQRWQSAAKLTFTDPAPSECRAAKRAWRRTRRLGRWRAAARLGKSAFTFASAADYLAWKIERHTGHRLDLSDWQRRHPILAALPLLIRLKRERIIH